MKNTGGPAFPATVNFQPMIEHDGIVRPSGEPTELYVAGMTLRDYFAAKAMQGIMSQPEAAIQHCPETLGQWSYSIADAMLAAREEER